MEAVIGKQPTIHIKISHENY